MDKPYIVSCDIYLLLNGWAARNGFVLPKRGFIEQIRDEFSLFMRGIFPSFELISEAELVEGISRLISEGGLMPISLDRVYLNSMPYHIDTTRSVDEEGKDRGIGHRPKTSPLLQQFRNLAGSGLKEVAIVDEVIFTGELVERIIRCLSRLGIRVPLVCAGIGIAEGINRINHSKREVRCVRIYNEVVDEVCERDFYPGIPFSGRLLIGDGDVGVPYLLPFGNPGKWASIPLEHQVSFSKFCIGMTIRLFEEIENSSNRTVSCTQVGRLVPMLPRDETRFADALREICDKLAD